MLNWFTKKPGILPKKSILEVVQTITFYFHGSKMFNGKNVFQCVSEIAKDTEWVVKELNSWWGLAVQLANTPVFIRSNRVLPTSHIIFVTSVKYHSTKHFGESSSHGNHPSLEPHKLQLLGFDLSCKPHNVWHRCCHFWLISHPVYDFFCSFYADFGPLNLAHVYRYCCKVNKKLKVSFRLVTLPFP